MNQENLRYQTDSERLKLAIEWIEHLQVQAAGHEKFFRENREKWTGSVSKDDYCLSVMWSQQRDANTALKEISNTKWPFQKVEESLKVILDKHVKGPTWAGYENAKPEIETLMNESGWDDEEYHWESIRHHESKPPFCACWNISPENKGQNPLPLNKS